MRQREARQQVTEAHRAHDQQRVQERRALTHIHRLSFEYEPEIENSSHALTVIGNIDKECQHCHAFKYKGESAGICCAAGKVSLPTTEFAARTIENT